MFGSDPYPSRDFWSNQRVLLTGHTGFKGSWAALWLERLGAEVFGYALAPDQRPSLFSKVVPIANLDSTIADLADRTALARTVERAEPTVVLHMAAKPLVRQSYADPVETFATNAMGTAHLLEAVRGAAGLKAVVIVTTDKVYNNPEDGKPFVESDRLGGHDPYSASKAAAELITASYAESFFKKAGVPVVTARGGNVIGGGDWSADRIVPDVWRAAHAGRPLELRHPNAVRPWQHVLDLVSGYLLYLERLSAGAALPKALNFGPIASGERVTVSEVAEAIGRGLGVETPWRLAEGAGPAEMQMLMLDAGAAVKELGWRPRLSARDALDWSVAWYRDFDRGVDSRLLCLSQIEQYESR